ncbi:hypothetical protein KQI84_01440 [bacterium]|nr:hypothetical protein [bacterium]
MNPLECPVVDFENYMVLAIVLGKSFNCVEIRVASIEESADRVSVTSDPKTHQTGWIDRKQPKDDGSVYPYGSFIVPRSPKPLIVMEDVQGMIGGEPIWKERARLSPLF